MINIKFYWTGLLTFIISSISLAQNYGTIYPEAPEIWSKPEPIFDKAISDSFGLAEEPSVTADGKTLYFDYIFVTHLTDTGWSMPKRLPDQITSPNSAGVEHPIISPDGRRLFFDWYEGGWYLYYSDWDSTKNNWGPVIDPGVPLNNPHPYWGSNWGCGPTAGCFLDDTTLIYTICGETFTSHWHSATANWDTAVSWPYVYPNSSWDGYRFGPGAGIAVTSNGAKVYQSQWHDDTTRDGKVYADYDLTVTYRDTSIEGDYGNPNVLNISLISDSLYFAGVDSGRYEGYPSITADGKTLFFEADYGGKYTVYVSHLLVDENGDTITSVKDKHPITLPNEFKLLPAYPDPFNPTTTITYSLPYKSNIKLSIYDVLGRKIKTLKNGFESSGEHTVTFEASGLASGIYIILFQTPQGILSTKMSLIK
jgi:hypothetical protein